MISTAGVHSHLDHYLAAIKLLGDRFKGPIYIHLILDGRDTAPRDSSLYINPILKAIAPYPRIRLASAIGREYAMDRNLNWDKTKVALQLLTQPITSISTPLLESINSYYQKGLDDESMPAIKIDKEGIIKQNDSVIFLNFREDRMRQLVKSLLPGYSPFPKETVPVNLKLVTMTEYEKGLPVTVAFSPQIATNCFSDCVSQASMTQLHLAESEKKAHVTYFFNGGREEPVSHETFHIVPSPHPSQFLLHPEMSAVAITNYASKCINSNLYDIYIINYANADMIGHTGNQTAAAQAVSCIDDQVAILANSILRKSGVFVITADHGNAESMQDPDSRSMLKEHTDNPVPFIIAHPSLFDPQKAVKKIGSDSSATGILPDVPVSLLTWMGLTPPPEMTGTTLFPLSF